MFYFLPSSKKEEVTIRLYIDVLYFELFVYLTLELPSPVMAMALNVLIRSYNITFNFGLFYSGLNKNFIFLNLNFLAYHIDTMAYRGGFPPHIALRIVDSNPTQDSANNKHDDCS